MDYPHPCDTNSASSLLFDVVVLAGGEASHMSPLCDAKPKPLLPLCNRPLIWYTLKPWVDAGVQCFHIVTHNESLEYMKHFLNKSDWTEFPRTVHFEYITVATNLAESETAPGEATADDEMEGIPTDSADGLRAFAKWRGSRTGGTYSSQRDVLVLSCDTILANVDLQPFIHNFYRTYASASTLLVAAPPKTQMKEAFYSSEDTAFTAVETNDSDIPATAVDRAIQHERLHMHYPSGAEESLDLSAGFVVRRPNLKFSKSAMDVHVYLFRGWVLDFLLENTAAIRSVRDDLISLLAVSQFWKVNGQEAIDPGSNLKFKIPSHWMVGNKHHSHGAGFKKRGLSSIASLNSMQDSLPRPWDDLRVFATTYSHDTRHTIVRINSKERYKFVSEEIVKGLLPDKPISSLTSPLQALVIQQLERETEAVTKDSGLKKTKGTALLSLPPLDAKIGRSVIGRGVKIGHGCKIQRSVIMDNVEIGDKAVITDCVICPNIQVPSGRVLEPTKSDGAIAVEVVAFSLDEEDDAREEEEEEFNW